MANQEQLPWDLTEEILSCVPPESLVRFRTVSKQWNALLRDKTFIKKHKTKMTYRFILATKSKIYSVSVNPEIEVLDLTLDIPALEPPQLPRRLMDCDGLLLCDMGKRAMVSNPWLRQTRWVEHEGDHSGLLFSGIGYDDDNRYKAIGTHWRQLDPLKTFWKTLDFLSDAWKEQRGVIKSSGTSSNSTTEEARPVTMHSTSGVSLNGTWYRVASYNETKYLYFIVNFDFTKETFNQFCDLPCEDNKHDDALVLRVFMGDRFSLLKQSNLTKKIQIWVTKNKIHKQDGRYVEWMNFMEVSVPNLPDLVQPSYFIDDKRLVVCSCDKDGQAWIYVVGNNNLISKTKVDHGVDCWPTHCSFIPSLVSVPGGKREEAE
ncbi:putative F-box protein [Raphanus sativus]|uniref:F-box protein At1g47390 n=1 Tax=Raphanus sativus TaxID=3726 RepID=A0A6J0NSN3_RAPSA|nr:putative F-box protein At1g47390 [Raphanus sativus]KAJ4893296.1 putative F-box protein [Raphanus sativus]